MPDSNDYLPEELVTQILLPLAVKPLLRCKSVSKLWLSIITNPSFTKSHLNFALIASKTNPTLLIIEYPPRQSVINHATLLQLQRHELVTLDLDDSHVRFTSSCLFMPRDVALSDPVVGTCNEIICLDYMRGMVVCLWNPAINMWKKVWTPSRGTRTYRLGFDYDCISDDYKVVRIVYEDSDDDVPTVQVYSTNGGCWRHFQDPILRKWKLHIPYGRPIDTVVNGVLYLDCFDKLVSFDFHKEVFVLVLFPKFIKRKRSDVLDYEGSVAMVFESVGDGLGAEVDLWTLDDVSGKIPWTKRFSVKDHFELWLSGYLGVGQFHGIMSCDQNSYLYDYEKKEVRFYRIRKNLVCATLKYTESLVSFDGFEQVQ